MRRDRQRWGLFVFASAIVLFCWIYLTTPPAQLAGSDGYYTYIYARSLVYDHDFDFTNDYRVCGNPHDKNRDRGGGHPENPFYVGPTIYWAPAMWIARHVIPLPKDAPPSDVNACRGPIAKWTLFVGPLLGALTLFLGYRLARRLADDGPAALSTALVGFGSSVVGYACIWPHYSHVYDAFSCALFLLLAVRAAEKPESWLRWALVGVLAGVCYLQRPPAVFFGIVPATLAAVALWKRWWRLVGVLALLAGLLAVTGILPQALLYKYFYGKYFLAGSPHGNYYIQLGHAHPWLSLFAPHGGLFFSTPSAWLAVFGVVPALRMKNARPLVLSGLLASWLIVYVSAAALDWDSSASFGNRRLTSLVAFMVPLAAVLLARIRGWMRKKRSRPMVAFGVAVLAPIMMLVVGDALCNGEMVETIERGHSQEELYGLGNSTVWKIVDRNIGDLAILPAEAIFKLRYGLKMNAFRDVTEPWIQRDYRSMAMRSNVPPPVDPRWASHITGAQHTAAGILMTKPRATLAFASEWPFATKLDVTLRSKRPARVTFAYGRFLVHDVVYGSVDLPGDDAPVSASLPIPPNGFDSGVDEIVMTTNAPDAEVLLTGIAAVDTNEYPNPL